MASAVAVAVGACGSTQQEGPQKQKAETSLVMKPVGSPQQSTFAERRVSLEVIVLRKSSAVEDSGDFPISGKQVEFAFVGPTPQSASMSTAAATTSQSGIARTEVWVGNREDITLQVRANAAGVAPVTFSIRVSEEKRELRLVGSASVAAVVDSAKTLRVRLVRPATAEFSEAPIGGATLHARLEGGPRNGARLLDAAGGESVELTTNASGLGSVRFRTGTQTGVSYDITFCGQGTCPGVESRTIRVAVAEQAGNSGGCSGPSDCAPNLVCQMGECAPVTCSHNNQCPDGYVCNFSQRRCTVWDGSGVCEGPQDCPTDWTCQDGVCTPPPGVGPAMDVRGVWRTTYHMDISETLPGVISGLGPVVDFLNLVFASQFEVEVPIIGDIIESLLDALIAEYVPPYVPTITQSLGDIIHVFKDLEVEGRMRLNQGPTGPPLGPDVTGHEQWTSAALFIPSTCAGGPAEFQQNPDCGRVDVVVEPEFDLDYSDDSPVVGARVEPFNGVVTASELQLTERKAALELRQLVNVALDLVVTVASEGDFGRFETFLSDAIPCAELQYAFDDLVCDLTDGDICHVAGVEAACEEGSLEAIHALDALLADVPVTLELTLDAHARHHDVNIDQVAEVLGDPSNPTAPGESRLEGRTDTLLIFGGDVGEASYWFAEREN